MFTKADFELPLEKQLRLRVIHNEIEHCDDRDLLKENLKECSKTLMSYQHLLGEMIKKEIMADLEMLSPEVTKIVDEITGLSDGQNKGSSD